MDPLTTAILAAIAPLTAAVFKGYELKLTRAKQQHEIDLATKKQEHELERATAAQDHEIAQATAAQNHKITTEYLDRALNPQTPIATRHALLRFLATKASDDDRLHEWAQAELAVVARQMAPFDHKVEEAIAKLESAKDVRALREAEGVLQLALDKKHALLAPPQQVALTPQAIRAGFFSMRRDLQKTNMDGEQLEGAKLNYTDLMNSSFRGAQLCEASFQGADLRGVCFADADLERARFYKADCRGVDFTDANLHGADFEHAHLEQAVLRGADLRGARLVCTYDDATVWPSGFDPDAVGAVKVASPASSDEVLASAERDA